MWGGLVDMYEEGVVKCVGVSNYGPKQLQKIHKYDLLGRCSAAAVLLSDDDDHNVLLVALAVATLLVQAAAVVAAVVCFLRFLSGPVIT